MPFRTTYPADGEMQAGDAIQGDVDEMTVPFQVIDLRPCPTGTSFGRRSEPRLAINPAPSRAEARSYRLVGSNRRLCRKAQRRGQTCCAFRHNLPGGKRRGAPSEAIDTAIKTTYPDKAIPLLEFYALRNVTIAFCYGRYWRPFLSGDFINDEQVVAAVFPFP